MAGKENKLPRYEAVALSIASQITRGTYPPGARLHGRSTLASLHRVSPETVRKAIALLEEYKVVEVVHGSGIRVLSVDQAEKYLQAKAQQQEVQSLVYQLQGMIYEQKGRLDQMEDLLKDIISILRRD